MFRQTHNSNTRDENCHREIIELCTLSFSALLSLSVMSVYTRIHEQSSIVFWEHDPLSQLSRAYMGSRRLMWQAQDQHGSASGPPHMLWLLDWCFVGCVTVEKGVFLALFGDLSTLFLLLGCSIQSQYENYA